MSTQQQAPVPVPVPASALAPVQAPASPESNSALGVALLNAIKQRSNTKNKEEIIAAAEKEIANWELLKAEPDGSAYAMWCTEDWNEALEIDNSQGLRTATLMSTSLYVGSQLFIEENPFKRYHQHQKRVDTAFDLFAVSKLMLNKSLTGLFIDVKKALGDAGLYKIAESVLIRRLGVLGVPLKNRALGPQFSNLITKMDTSKWDTVAFKIIDDAVQQAKLMTTTIEQMRAIQIKVESLKCLSVDGLSLFFRNLLSDNNASGKNVFDGFDPNQMTYYANLVSNLRGDGCTDDWLHNVIQSGNEAEMVSCPVESRSFVTNDESNELFDKVIAKYEKKSGTAEMEIKRWNVVKEGPNGYVYVGWHDRDWNHSKQIEDKKRRICYLMSTARYVGREVIRQKTDVGIRSEARNMSLNLDCPFDMQCYANRLHGQRITIAYITPFGDPSKCFVAEHILISVLKELSIPIENVLDGCTIDDFIAKHDKSNWLYVAFNLFDELMNSALVFTTSDIHIEKTKLKHIKVERLLKVDPMVKFIQQLCQLDNIEISMEELKQQVNGFNEHRISFYVDALVKCYVLDQRGDDTFELHRWFRNGNAKVRKNH